MFEIDPAMLLSEHRRARADGHRVLGHYHSHPGGKPVPSLRDAANAHQDGALWVIATADGALAAFCAVEGGVISGRFDRVDMELTSWGERTGGGWGKSVVVRWVMGGGRCVKK